MTAMPERWRVLPGKPVKLASIDPSSTAGAPGGKAETLATLPAFHARLAGLQDRQIGIEEIDSAVLAGTQHQHLAGR